MKLPNSLSWKALSIIVFFTLAYLTLAIIKHNHFLSGYDLAVSDQVMWKYAYFHNPLTTINTYAFTYLMDDHVEFIYLFLAPIFWIWNNVLALISAQVIFFCLSALPVYYLARKKGLSEALSLTLIFSYLLFFGTQNALWNDVHSNVFGVGFLTWMIYFLESGNSLWLWISFFFSITSKEDMAFLTGAIGVVWLIKQAIFSKRITSSTNIISRIIFFGKTLFKSKKALLLIFFSALYLFCVFVIYFPHFTPQGYRFAHGEGLLTSVLHVSYFFDATSKQQILLDAFGSFGFLPLFAPLYLLPLFADLYHFFVLGHLVESASEIFLHYRVSLAPLLIWPTTIVLGRWKKLQHPAIAVYLIICALLFQYLLHLPLSYIAKPWFWHAGPEVASINRTLTLLPKDASVVTQVNIAPHIAHRDIIFTLWPTTLSYKNLSDSPCGKLTCRWFHWVGNPKYMIVDTSTDFDIRYFLQNRPDFLEALATFEKLGKIKIVHRDGTTTLYKVIQNP